MNSSLPG
jgi:hypothetical protein